MTSHLKPGLARTALLTMCICLVLGGHQSVASASWENQTNSQPSQIKQAVSKGAVLLVDTDDACRLVVDDEDRGVITAAQSQKFKVEFGDHILKCTIEGIPDLVWRKVISVKDSSQVAAVITLKALHLQYNQAVAKAQSQKEEAESAASKQLREAEAEEKQREAANAAMPQTMFEHVKGQWSCTFTMQLTTFYYSIDFVSIEDGLIAANFSYTARAPMAGTVGAKWSWVFKPEPGRLVATGMAHCEMMKGVKSLMKPGAKKDKDGYAECSVKDSPNTGTIIVNESSIQFDSHTFQR